jgi:hypothetical protein
MWKNPYNRHNHSIGQMASDSVGDAEKRAMPNHRGRLQRKDLRIEELPGSLKSRRCTLASDWQAMGFSEMG